MFRLGLSKFSMWIGSTRMKDRGGLMDLAKLSMWIENIRRKERGRVRTVGLPNQGPKCVNESVHSVCECKSSLPR